MKYAWVENDCIRDIAPGDPAEYYHPDIAKFYDTQVPDEANNGDGWVNGQLIKPEPAPPRPPPPPTWTVDDIRAALPLSERVKWDNNKTDNIVTAKIEMAKPQEIEHTTEVLQFLVDAGDISQASMDKALSVVSLSNALNINTASETELTVLSGVGPTMAQAIVNGRPWSDVTELATISGISQSMIDGWDIEV